MKRDRATLPSAEEACRPVRGGEHASIEELSNRFRRNEGGILSIFRRERKERPGTIELLASFEALCAKGDYKASISSIEELLERKDVHPDLRRTAVARVGQVAVINDIPLDLGPIISELDLASQDIKDALTRSRASREKRRELVEMEIELLRSLLLDSQADRVESPELAGNYLKGAMDACDKANYLGTMITGDQKGYHLTRCMYHTVRFLLKRGDHSRGVDGVEACIKRCRRSGFQLLLMHSLSLKGEYLEDHDNAVRSLEEALEISRSLGNNWESARILYIMSSRELEEEGNDSMMRASIERICEASKIAGEAGDEQGSADYLLEAAIWDIRSGSPEKALEKARKVYRSIRSGTNQELEIRSRAIILHAHILEGHRRKAKASLMDLVTNYPVKQYERAFGILKEAVMDVEWLREDKDTRELFESEMVYRIEKEAVAEIIRRAKEAFPNEFGAMLRGIEHITHIDPVMEGAGNRNSFLFSLYSRFSQRNLDGEGVVHSHPSGSARPSKADLSMFGRFPGINIIIGYPYSEDSMVAYDRLGNRVILEIVDGER